MPQFELDADGATRQVRGRSADDACRRALALDADADLAVGEAALGTGWRPVVVDGAPRARVRARDRMRFRRD